MYLGTIDELRFERSKHVAAKFSEIWEDLKRSLTLQNVKLFILGSNKYLQRDQKTSKKISKNKYGGGGN